MGLIGGLVSTVLAVTSILLQSSRVCTLTNTVTETLTESDVASQILSTTITPTQTVHEFETITVDDFETFFVDEEYIDIGSLTTDSVGYEVLEEFKTEVEVLTNTFYSGQGSRDTTSYISSTTLFTTRTTVITVPTLMFNLESITNTITITTTNIRTRYHFHDELHAPDSSEMVCLPLYEKEMEMLLLFFPLFLSFTAIASSINCMQILTELDVETLIATLTSIRHISEYATTTETMEATKYTDTTLTLTLYEEITSTETITEANANDAIEEFVTKYEYQVGTLHSGETTVDTTSYSTILTTTTSTTDILRIKNGFSLETNYEIITENATIITTQYHFTDVTTTTTLITLVK